MTNSPERTLNFRAMFQTLSGSWSRHEDTELLLLLPHCLLAPASLPWRGDTVTGMREHDDRDVEPRNAPTRTIE
jgi:hypothetical protein